MATSWNSLVALALLANGVGLALLLAGLRARTRQRLVWLRRRAAVCAGLCGSAAVLGVAFGMLQMARALNGGGSVDPSAQARVLAEGIATAMNGVALAMLALPLPIAALLTLVVRVRRLRGAAPAPLAAPPP